MIDTTNSSDRSGGRSSDILIYLSLGVLVGVVGTVLLAPASGRATRRKIGELAGELVESTDRIARRTGEVIKDQKSRVGQAIDAGKQAYRQSQDTPPTT